jgi:hypothetical protein
MDTDNRNDSLSGFEGSINLELNSPAHSSGVSFSVTLCRYREGLLVKELLPLQGTEYITISHVWGQAKWQTIQGVEGEVLASSEKAKFIAKQLPSIVGLQRFWMDILCIDQRDKTARIAVTQHIPTIFRCAQRTILVRNSSGVRDCCGQMLGDLEEWLGNEGDGYDALQKHYFNDQHEGKQDELVLSRLWLFQEILLSDCIQVVRCNEAPEIESSTETNSHRDSFVEHVLVNLQSVAGAWVFYRNPLSTAMDQKQKLTFMYAYLNCGTVTMESSPTSRPFPTMYELMTNFHSTRKTSHPRDFILAVMPQYDFYTVPANAKQMSFGELFVDCFQQAHRGGFRSAPLLTKEGEVHPSELGLVKILASDNIPEPTCLGDLVKLFLGYRPPSGRLEPLKTNYPSSQFYPVDVQPFEYPDDVTETMGDIKDCLMRSDMLWTNIMVSLGDLGFLELNESNREIYAATMILQICASSSTDVSIAESLLIEYPALKISAIRLAAVICCGLGISALAWSKENQTLVTVKFRGHTILALLSNSIALPRNRFILVEAEQLWPRKERFCLLACDPNELGSYSVCLFPPIYLFD